MARTLRCSAFLLVLILGGTLAAPAESTYDELHSGSPIQPATSQAEPKLGVTEKLGNPISLDAAFLDEEGLLIHLRDLIDKPTLVLPVYFTCPNVCDALQASIAGILPDVDLEPGKEYQVISVSFDPSNQPSLAKSKKHDYLAAINAPFPPQAWRFLTGDEPDIAALMEYVVGGQNEPK